MHGWNGQRVAHEIDEGQTKIHVYVYELRSYSTYVVPKKRQCSKHQNKQKTKGRDFKGNNNIKE